MNKRPVWRAENGGVDVRVWVTKAKRQRRSLRKVLSPRPWQPLYYSAEWCRDAIYNWSRDDV